MRRAIRDWVLRQAAVEQYAATIAGHVRASWLLAVMLKSQILNGTSWLLAGRLTSNLLGIASTLIAARLLMPEDFGLMATAMSVSAIAIASAGVDYLSGPRLFS
jgi:uncharacterized membrane protein